METLAHQTFLVPPGRTLKVAEGGVEDCYQVVAKSSFWPSEPPSLLPGSEAGRSHGWIPRIPESGRLGQGQVLDKQIKGE